MLRARMGSAGSPTGQDRLDGADEDQDEGDQVEHLGDGVGEQEDCPIQVVGHIEQLGDGAPKASGQMTRITQDM